MKVFKFGGASIVDAQGVRNVADIIQRNATESMCIVVSAMGKTTNALEEIVHAYFNKTGKASQLLETLKQKHLELLRELFPNERNQVEDDLEDIAELPNYLSELQKTISFTRGAGSRGLALSK